MQSDARRRKRVRVRGVLGLVITGCLLGCAEEEQRPGTVDPWPIPAVGGTVGGKTPTFMRDGGFGPSLDAGARLDGASDAAGSGDAALPPLSALDLFDPDEVYLYGSLTDTSSCRYDTLIALSAPARVVRVGCDSTTHAPLIRPSDGRLLYTGTAPEGGLYAFRHDDPASPSTSGQLHDATANDDRLAAAPCRLAVDAPSVRLTPEERALFVCGKFWVDERDVAIVEAEPEIRAFGPGDTALRADGVFHIRDRVLKPFAGLALDGLLAVRTRADGFWVVGTVAVHPGERIERWHVALDGSSVREGVYPELPTDDVAATSGPVLDGRGRLLQTAYRRLLQTDDPRRIRGSEAVVRRSIEGESIFLYDQAEQSPFYPAISARWQLITGP